MNRKAERAKKFLNQYKTAFEEVQICTERISEIRTKQMAAGSPRLDDMPKGNKQIDLSDYIVRLELLREEWERKKAAEQAVMRSVRVAIEKLCSADDRLILSLLYIDFLNFKEIAEVTEIDINTIYKRHERALERLVY